MPALLDLRGQRFGHLIVLARAASGPSCARWLCRCDCGTEKVVASTSLRNGDTKSCGCAKIERAKTLNRRHGKYRSPEYYVWQAAKDRCANPRNPNFANYGGRGISMLPEWADSFTTFLAHVGNRPPGTSLDRIDNAGNYEPGNVRWAAIDTQNNNSRFNRWIEVGGERMTIAQAASRHGVNYQTFYMRLSRGWTPEQAAGIAPR